MTLGQYSVSAAQPGLSVEVLGQLRVPVPPLSEQRRIGSYVASESARIQLLIAEHQRLIDLLREKRQAVISRAVTKGLDPDVAMKPSGIGWLGKVPKHWTVTQLGLLLHTPPCYGVLVPDFDPEGVPMLRIMDMRGDRVDRSDLTTITPGLSEQYSRTILEVGDVVLSVVGTIGQSLLIGAALAGANLSRAVARLRPSSRIDPAFLCALLQSSYFEEFVEEVCVGSAQRVLNMSALAKFRVPLPSLEEQRSIVAHVDKQVTLVNALQLEAQRFTDLLQERRTALISAAVTGKIDVRGNAGTEAA